jgi:hypothetical protein
MKTLIVVFAVVAAAAVGSAQMPTLDGERNRLLITYNGYKGYGLTSPDAVYAQLQTEDRRAVFNAIVRALFIEILDKKGNSTGKRPIAYLEALHGVWGVRQRDQEGKRQFRLSVRWNPDLVPLLEASGNLPKGSRGHVIMGVPKANEGDDNATFNKWDIRESDVVTFRQPKEGSPSARLQLSMLGPQFATGEVDIDVDTGWICHNRPANSDVGSIDGTKESHLVEYNGRFDFMPPLQLKWSSNSHCQPEY